MNVVVLNGSPGGLQGRTAQYVKYLEQRFPEHRFQTVEVARRIHQLERDRGAFDAVISLARDADLVLWAFPVYVMLVPAQLKRFIELVFERAPRALVGKVTGSLSTSAHHYDHTAHDYMEGICADLGMPTVRGFSAGGEDLLTERGRRDVVAWMRELVLTAAGEVTVDVPPPPVEWSAPRYEPTLTLPEVRRSARRVLIISDADPGDDNLERMIDVFTRSVPAQVDRLELRQLRLDGGCLGCMTCSDDGRCCYRDDFAQAFATRVLPADVIVYAGRVRDRSLSARMKIFIDRYFMNGHRPVTQGKLMGFLVSGPLSRLATLREVLDAHVEVCGCQRLGVVTDESADADATTRQLVGLARATGRWLDAPWFRPPTFRGWAAMKNFRDLVYSHRGLMTADHRYYKDHGLYDFPQRRLGNWLFNAALLVLKALPFFAPRVKRGLRTGHTRSLRLLLAREAGASGGGAS